MAKESQDIAQAEPLDGKVIEKNVHDKFAERMAMLAKLNSSMDDGDRQQAQDNISERLFTAKSEDELWDADEGSLPNAQDLVGVEQRIFGFDIRQSNDETKKNPRTGNTYLVIHAARLDNGEEFDWQTSSTLICQKLMVLRDEFHAFDGTTQGFRDVRIIAVTTNSGTEVLKLQRVSARAI